MSLPSRSSSRKRRQRKKAGEGGSFQDRAPILRFLGLFIAWATAFYIILGTPFFVSTVLPGYFTATATVSAFLLGLIGQDVGSNGSMVSSPNFWVEIKYGCDGLEPAALFGCAAFAFPVGLGFRAIGFFVGAVILQVLNVIRIVTLFLIGVYWPDAFHVFHVQIWQIVFVLISIVLWWVWARWSLMRPAREITTT